MGDSLYYLCIDLLKLACPHIHTVCQFFKKILNIFLKVINRFPQRYKHYFILSQHLRMKDVLFSTDLNLSFIKLCLKHTALVLVFLFKYSSRLITFSLFFT